jgi:O6-methylguanine-DNA--protein-cysteine methyltransferase
MNVPIHDAKLTFDSPVGAITLLARDNKVVYLTMCSEITPDFGKASILQDAKKQLISYFKGKSKELNFATELEGTAFQKAVWNEISKIGGTGKLLCRCLFENLAGRIRENHNGFTIGTY